MGSVPAKTSLHDVCEPPSERFWSLGALTLVRDKVCENAMHGTAVSQVSQGPGTVRYEQYLVPGPWKRSSPLRWVAKHQTHHKVIHMRSPTVYRFQFSRCSVGFHTEVLHPSRGAFVHSRKIYRLSLQAEELRSSFRSTMGYFQKNQNHNAVKAVGFKEKNTSHSWCGRLEIKQWRTMIETLLERLGWHP